MKKLPISLLCMLSIVTAYAKPHCQGFNNYDNKVTITFTDDDAREKYIVTEIKLFNCGKEQSPTAVKTNIEKGVATVVVTFPHATRFSNPKVSLRVNGKKVKFAVCQ